MISRRLLSASLVTGVLALAIPAFVTPVDAKTTRKPKGATAQCEDGSYSHAKTQQGACSSHGGVKTWYGDAAVSTPAAPPSKTTSTSRAARPPRASAPAATPAGATAKCNDGSYSSAQSRQGACAGHGGVATWLSEETPRTTAAPRTSSEEQRPRDATAKCKDGSYSSAQSHSGACAGHGGVATWLTDSTARTTAAPRTPPEEQETVPPASTTVENREPGRAPVTTARAGATAKCKDGTYSHAKHHTGACSYHGGVAEWYK
jgi:hypothetical protein